MFRRRLLMMAATSQGPGIELPAGWTAADYVYFDRAKLEYIDTGIVPTMTTKVEVMTSGDHNDYSHDRFFGNDRFMIWNGNAAYKFVLGTEEVSSTGTYTAGGGGRDWVKLIKEGNFNSATIFRKNGTTEEVTCAPNTQTSLSTTKTMWIGRANNITAQWALGNNLCQYLKIWQDGVLVKDYIPVTDGTQQGLFDQVTKTLFYKQTAPQTLDVGNEAEGGVE